MALWSPARSSLVHRVGDPRVFLAAAERHTLTMRYGHGRVTASGPIGRRSPDQPVAAALSPGLRRTQKVNTMMDLRAARARPAEAIDRAMLAGRGTRRYRWRQIARHREDHSAVSAPQRSASQASAPPSGLNSHVRPSDCRALTCPDVQRPSGTVRSGQRNLGQG
eukprot:scaffold98596_cov76-Phaeocystis_antarctica.AAC.1